MTAASHIPVPVLDRSIAPVASLFTWWVSLAWFVVDSKMGLACLGRYLWAGIGIYCADNLEDISILSQAKDNEDEEEGKEK